MTEFTSNYQYIDTKRTRLDKGKYVPFTLTILTLTHVLRKMKEAHAQYRMAIPTTTHLKTESVVTDRVTTVHISVKKSHIRTSLWFTVHKNWMSLSAGSNVFI